MTARATTRAPTAQESVLASLRSAIIAGELRPGQQVRQDALAHRFGVSRVPLREALKILEGEGQVTYYPHRGYFVAELDVAALREVYRIRDLLETDAVRLAVPHLTPEDLSRLEAACDDVDRAAATADLVAMTEANRRFHFTLIEAARMPRLARIIRILWDATDAYRSLYYSEPGHRSHVHDEHVAVMDAVRRGDADSAIDLLRQHRERAVTAVAEVLESAASTQR